MQDIEFTIERGRLYMLQRRDRQAHRRRRGAIAVDMVRERLIDREEALLRVDAGAL